jgi:hypothetical protein
MAPLEMIAAGGSVLLRVHVAEPVDRADAMLIVDHGDEMDVVAPLEGDDGAALGFLLDAAWIGGESRLLLNAGGVLSDLAGDLARDATT